MSTTVPLNIYHIGTRAFSSDSPDRQGEVLHELIRFDPALDTHPLLARRLLRNSSSDLANDDTNELSLASSRRRSYFEWTETDLQSVTGDPHALGLSQARHYRWFRELSITRNLDSICRKLCGGYLPPRRFATTSVGSTRCGTSAHYTSNSYRDSVLGREGTLRHLNSNRSYTPDSLHWTDYIDILC